MITSVYIDTDELVFQLHSVSDDAQKALEWVRSFRDTLMFGARIANPLPFAMECMAMSEGFSASGVLGKLRAAARKRLNDEGIEATPEAIDAQIVRTQGADAVREMTAKIARANRLKAEIRRRKFTADGDIREDSQDVPDGSNSGILESGTSANNSKGDAVSSDATEVCYNRESGAFAPTTVSRNMRRVPQNEAPAHGFSGGDRAAQGPMSRSPEAAAQSGKDYDQEPYQVSTDEDRQSRRAGGNSLRVAKVSTSPARSAGPAKHQHGEFRNVMLTDDEFAKLCEKCQDADSLITELDQYIESQGKTKKYKSHYATLLNWSRRKAQEAKPQQRYKNINDINKENYEKAMREIEAMCAGEAV